MNPSTLFSVTGKNVLVTGGSRGIGLMIAKGFCRAGANVLLTSRDEAACAEAVATVRQQQQQQQQAGAASGDDEAAAVAGGTCQYVTSNLSHREGCEELVHHVDKVFQGRLDVLVNNAGTSWGEPPERDSKSNWGFDRVLDLNVKGIFYLTRACLPLLGRSARRDERDPARIINIGSVAGLLPQEAPTHAYDISKAAVHHLTRKFAAELAANNVTVNCLAPGFVPSRMSSGLAAWGGDATKLAAAVPLRRLGREDDVVGACLYFASRAGSWCTGVVLPVDGGTIGAAQIPIASL
jgi:NAD(P)-dependent dehydrogenase (short-subunit alcohol dehydrogenase family)